MDKLDDKIVTYSSYPEYDKMSAIISIAKQNIDTYLKHYDYNRDYWEGCLKYFDTIFLYYYAKLLGETPQKKKKKKKYIGGSYV